MADTPLLQALVERMRRELAPCPLRDDLEGRMLTQVEQAIDSLDGADWNKLYAELEREDEFVSCAELCVKPGELIQLSSLKRRFVFARIVAEYRPVLFTPWMATL